MTQQELVQLIGQRVRVRPLPTGILAAIAVNDDFWHIADGSNGTITLTNALNHRSVSVLGDDVRERREPDFLILDCQIEWGVEGYGVSRLKKSKEPYWQRRPGGFSRRA